MNDVARADTRVATAKALRTKRARRIALRLILGVGVPTAVAALYYGVFITKQHESDAAFTVQSADANVAPTLELLIATVPGSSAGRDSLLIQEYARSRGMLQLLSEEHGWREHYSSDSIDFISRLGADASEDDRLDYFREHVSVDYEGRSGVLTLRVRAFSAAKAQEIATAIIAASEEMVNRMMQKARDDRIALAERELHRAEERLTKARQAVLREQGARGEINPLASAEAVLRVRSDLEGELASARAELATLGATLQPDAPRLIAQRQRVGALARQVEEQNRRLAGGDDDGLNTTIALFEPVIAEKEFAEHAYLSAEKSLEIARIEADRQHRYVITLSEPSRPDQATIPRFFTSVLTIFVLSFALLGIGTLVLASIREHANV